MENSKEVVKEKKLQEGKEEREREKERREQELKIQEDWKRKTTLIIRKGRFWKSINVDDWLKEIGVKSRYTKRIVDNEGKTLSIEFEREEDRIKVWGEERRERFAETYTIDEWLSLKERSDRYRLWEKAERIMKKNEEEGVKIKIIKENRSIIIGGERYVLDGKGNLIKIKELLSEKEK